MTAFGTLTLLAPLRGWSTPLEEAPDPVFAARMLGDGVAIDPLEGVLHAPCDGELITVAPSRHSVTVRTAGGVSVLLHLGIDTVRLGGEGFELHVRPGQRVHAGQRLISFDLELVARRAKSLLTPMIVLEQPRLRIASCRRDCEVQVGERILELEIGSEPGGPSQPSGESQRARETAYLTRRVTVAFEHGIHARPAALLARTLGNLEATVSVLAHRREVNARSPVALMGLGLKHGDELELRATGRHAQAALDSLSALLERGDGAGESLGAPRERPSGQPAPPNECPAAVTEAQEGVLAGVIASRGIALGTVVQWRTLEPAIAERGRDVAYERGELDRARGRIRARLQRAMRAGAQTAREIAQAHAQLLDDPELVEAAGASIGQGKSAGFAWRLALRAHIERLRSLSDARMAERADDLIDLETQVLLELAPHAGAMARVLSTGTVLLARELPPSELMALDTGQLAGICLAGGGPTSHVALLAASLGIPMLVAAGPAVLAIPEATEVCIDAEHGRLEVAPADERRTEIQILIARRRDVRARELASAAAECRTADGERIELLANVGSVAEAKAAARNGAHGCGLLRTEFLFLDRRTPPEPAEQTRAYEEIAAALGGGPITFRTLDVGGDKELPYLPMPQEENPALGLRGIRMGLRHPALLREQLRAILAVRGCESLRIMLPMITEADEIRAARGLLEEISSPGSARPAVELGVMIETPAAAVGAERIAAVCDFLSIGTNDLTQYSLAMDRGQPELAARLDALHPGVLRLIRSAVEGARRHERRIGVCGGLASEEAGALVLVGLGVRELSVVPAMIPTLKARIACCSLEELRQLATAALEQESAAAVRALCTAVLQRSPVLT